MAENNPLTYKPSDNVNFVITAYKRAKKERRELAKVREQANHAALMLHMAARNHEELAPYAMEAKRFSMYAHYTKSLEAAKRYNRSAYRILKQSGFYSMAA